MTGEIDQFNGCFGSSRSRVQLRSSHRRMSPGYVVLFWTLSVAIRLYIAMSTFSFSGVATQVLNITGTAIFAGFVAGWILGLRATTLRLLMACSFIDFLTASFALVIITRQTGEATEITPDSFVFLFIIPVMLIGFVMWRSYPFVARARFFLALTAVAIISALPFGAAYLDERIIFAAVANGPSTPQYDPPPKIDADKLWEAQDALIKRSVAGLLTPISDQDNIYSIAIAPQGQQALFAREAKAAIKMLASTYDDHDRGGILLSNDKDDYGVSPLATRGNFETLVRSISERMKPDRDILAVYLASHGSKDATLETGLADFTNVQPISAQALNSAMNAAHIQKRIIMVSACYAGSWIPIVANENSIIITAASADRTSFGCTDDRRMTYFGEAFLKRPIAPDASLSDRFVRAQQIIARWEKAQKLMPSRPQVFVGRNMQSVWTEAH